VLSRENRGSLLAVAWLILLVTAALTAPFLPLTSPLSIDLDARFAAPDLQHLLGTDELGRDVLARSIHAAAASLSITAGATFLDIVFATGAGLIAAYRRGWIDRLLSLAIDFFWTVPLVVLVVLITSVLGVDTLTLIVTIAGINWISAARILRTEIYRLRQEPFVRAARAAGFPLRSILMQTILPNIRPLLVALSAYTAIEVLTIESGLAFLGLSLPAPSPTWGGMLADGSAYIRSAWWLVGASSLAIIITLASFLTVARRYESASRPHAN